MPRQKEQPPLNINYVLSRDNPQSFYIKEDETVIISAETQYQAEKYLDEHIKSITNKKCPLKAISDNMILYTITSYNDYEQAVWTRCEEESDFIHVGKRIKTNLIGWGNSPVYFKTTPNNLALKDKYDKIQTRIKELSKEARNLIGKLEEPLTQEYFMEL